MEENLFLKKEANEAMKERGGEEEKEEEGRGGEGFGVCPFLT